MFPSVVVEVLMAPSPMVVTVVLVASRCRLDLPILMIPQVPLVDLLAETQVDVAVAAVTLVVVHLLPVQMVPVVEAVVQPHSVIMVVRWLLSVAEAAVVAKLAVAVEAASTKLVVVLALASLATVSKDSILAMA